MQYWPCQRPVHKGRLLQAHLQAERTVVRAVFHHAARALYVLPQINYECWYYVHYK